MKVITEQLNGFEGVSVCDPQPDEEDLKVYPVSLPHDVIKIGVDSNLLDPNIVRHLLLMYSVIKDYNRWSDLGFELLTNPNKEKSLRQLQMHTEIMNANKEEIELKARLLTDCLLEGTSDLDKDCY